jgi:hypothetical protein
MIPCELYSLSKSNFLNFVRDRAYSVYHGNMITLHPDWVLRKCFVNNSGWQEYRSQYVQQKREEMAMMS